MIQSQNLEISGGEFNNYTDTGRSRGIWHLYQNISASAVHDSDERYEAPKCHHETRQTILNDIMTWIFNVAVSSGTTAATSSKGGSSTGSDGKRVLWIHGPARAGKSSILQTIAQFCERHHLLASSFFFSRTSQDRNDAQKLFATLSYQLATRSRDFRERVQKIIDDDYAVVRKSMEVQLKRLVLQPLGSVQCSTPTAMGMSDWHSKEDEHEDERATCSGLKAHVIIIDALDECAEEQQSPLLQLLLLFLESTYNKHPFLLIISSRPEPIILHEMESVAGWGGGYRGLSWEIMLDKAGDIKRDLEVVLRSGFDRIRRSGVHAMAMRDAGVAVDGVWPLDWAIERLVGQSARSGHFVYVDTILKFIDDPDCSPVEQLDSILRVTSSPGDGNEDADNHASAFFDLDKLYIEILSRCTNPSRTIEALGNLMALLDSAQRYSKTWLGTAEPLGIVDRLLELKPGDSFRALRGLGSLFSVRLEPVAAHTSAPNASRSVLQEDSKVSLSTGVRFFHASFMDFLKDKSRSKEFYVDIGSAQLRITRACLRVLTRFSKECKTQDDYLVWVYAVIFWPDHCCHAPPAPELLDDLRVFDVVKHWLSRQTVPPISSRVDSEKLVDALAAFDTCEITSCPGQARWVPGLPDLQTMAFGLKEVHTWFPNDPDLASPEMKDRYAEAAMHKLYMRHLSLTKDPRATIKLLGVLLHTETSAKILCGLLESYSDNLEEFFIPLAPFLYIWRIGPNLELTPLKSSLSRVKKTIPVESIFTIRNLGQSTPHIEDFRLGIKCSLFRAFLNNKSTFTDRRFYSDPRAHADLIRTLLDSAEKAAKEQWNSFDYAEAWTDCLRFVPRNVARSVFLSLRAATEIYLTSSSLRVGLQHRHRKRVREWLAKRDDILLSSGVDTLEIKALFCLWSSHPIEDTLDVAQQLYLWKDHILALGVISESEGYDD